MLCFRFIAEEKHFRDRNLYITCIASISDVWQAPADDAAVGILGNVTQQTNQIVIGASPGKQTIEYYDLIDQNFIIIFYIMFRHVLKYIYRS